MIEINSKRGWDSKTFNTGRVNGKSRPIYATKIQNGLHDIEPDGSFVECDLGVEEVTQGVTHLRVKRGRYGEMRFGDSGHANNFLFKVKKKGLKGISLKYSDAVGETMSANAGRPSCHFDNGIDIVTTPSHKGAKVEIVINNPTTAPLEYTFSIKTYGQDYTFVEENGGITMTGEDQDPIFIKAPYAYDANGDSGPVSIALTGIVDNLQTFKKVVDEAWLRNAAAPVVIDPLITIDDTTGTFIDGPLQSANPTFNNGLTTFLWAHLFAPATNEATFIVKCDSSAYSRVTITSALFGLTSSARVGDGYNIILNRIIAGPWIEGTKINAVATAGEPSWDRRVTGGAAWNNGGCNGSGTDYQVSAESTTFVGSSGLHTFDISVATMQDIIDNPSTDYGFVFRTTDAAVGEYEQFYSSEGAGTKPYLQFEYTTSGTSRNLLLLLRG
jgi:hypothetical protein